MKSFFFFISNNKYKLKWGNRVAPTLVRMQLTGKRKKGKKKKKKQKVPTSRIPFPTNKTETYTTHYYHTHKIPNKDNSSQNT